LKKTFKHQVAALGASLGIVSDILGKESAAGKAAALAQAVINTYQGITAGITCIQQLYQQ
jgi:hypothetical protein